MHSHKSILIIPATARRLPTDPSAFKREPPSPPGGRLASMRAADKGKTTPEKPPPLMTKTEAPTPKPVLAEDAEKVKYCMNKDPVILSFVREKLQSHPILALSELTKDCQVGNIVTRKKMLCKLVN